MDKKIKLLLVVTQSEIGGAQRYIFDLAKNLPQERFDIAIAAGGDGELFAKTQANGIKTYRLKHLVREITTPHRDLLAFFELKKIYRQFQPDVVHLNSSKAGVLGSLAAKSCKIKKVVYTVHGFVFNEPLPAWKKKFYLLAEKISAFFKDAIICVSAFDKSEGIAQGIAKPEKLIVIHNGIKPLASKNDYSRQYPLTIGTIANFYPTKGLTYLIASAVEVLKKYPEVIFTIIGDGSQRTELEKLIQDKGIENHIKLIGVKPKVEPYLLGFDIFVMPSLKEGMPYAILEAMSVGLPIVASRVGGIPEMLTDGISALLVEPKNSTDLSKKIITLLDDQKLAMDLAQNAKREFQQNFLLEKMVSKTKAVYEQ